jgi:hypothetical protein
LLAVSNARNRAKERQVNIVPENLDAKLTRKQAAEALTAAGFPISDKTLATMATRGGGPLYQLFGRKPLYTWRDALEWARGRLSKPVHTTSELEAA